MHAPIGEAQVKKVALYAGLVALAAGIGMAFEYGRAMSYLHAVSLALLAIAGSVGFVGADILRSKGRRTAAGVVTVATVGLLLAEYGTHFGYTVGHRARDQQETTVQNATHKAVQENREAEKANLTLWQEQLKALMAQNAWATTVKADGLREELATLKDRMVKEEQGQRGRKAGKGKEFTNPGLDLADFIGTAFTTAPDGKIYQLPDQQFANLYWFRADWFASKELKDGFRAKYGYELGVPLNWSAYEDIASCFSNDVKELDGQKVFGHMDYGKRDPSLGWRFTDAWLSMAGNVDRGIPNGKSEPPVGVVLTGAACV